MSCSRERLPMLHKSTLSGPLLQHVMRQSEPCHGIVATNRGGAKLVVSRKSSSVFVSTLALYCENLLNAA
jgi:hypothetical protein